MQPRQQPRTKEEARLEMSRLGSEALKHDVAAIEATDQRTKARHTLGADTRRKSAAEIRALLDSLPESL